MATIPFAPALLASLRLARLLRLAALGSRAIAAERVLTTRRGFRYVALLTVLLVVLAGVAASITDAEDISSPWTGVWWAITTVTTVGYGDIVPHTVIGRTIAAALMLVGIGFVSMLTAVIASSFVAHDANQQSDSEQILAELQAINRRLDQLEATQRPDPDGPQAATPRDRPRLPRGSHRHPGRGHLVRAAAAAPGILWEHLRQDKVAAIPRLEALAAQR